jgi:transcriptional regulator with XRE-family HTH domain
MKQIELATLLGVSEPYVSMILKGTKKPSKSIQKKLIILGVNLEMVNFEFNKSILSHARLPIPTLPRS